MLRKKIGLKRTGFKRKPKKRSKQPSITKAKKEAWKWFSLFIRHRDRIPGTRMVKCVTCGRICPVEGQGAIHAGHFVAGRGNAALYDEHNCNGQCFACNLYNSGAWVEYEQYIIKTYGSEECQRLKSLRHMVVPMSAEDHLSIASTYKKRVEQMRQT